MRSKVFCPLCPLFFYGCEALNHDFILNRMKDCGEDLLVEISEILFNELAFYKLMQELQGSVYVVHALQ